MKNILVIGASSGGQLIASEVLKRDDKYHLIGYLDADKNTHGQHFHGVKVLGDYDNLDEFFTLHSVDEMIVAIANLEKNVLDYFIDVTDYAGVSLSIIPNVLESNLKESLLGQLRAVNATDLLGRPSVTVDGQFLNSQINGRSVLVTGAAGSIGSEIVRQLAKFSPKLIVGVDINENELYFLKLELQRNYPQLEFKAYIANIRESESLDQPFSHAIDMVFHAAAHKHVPLMEDAPLEAIKNNVQGTLNVLTKTAASSAASFVLISTDKAVNPSNIMGASKRLAELLTTAFSKTHDKRFMSVRFGNVLGSNGSVIPIFKTLIQEGRDLTVTHPDATRYFMTIPEAAQLVIEAGCRGSGGELFVLDMGDPVKIMDLAKKLIKLSGLREGVDIHIQITGFRPGEKLHEELFYDPSAVLRTKNPKIFLSNQHTEPSISVEAIEQVLRDRSYVADPKGFFKEFVAEYDQGLCH